MCSSDLSVTVLTGFGGFDVVIPPELALVAVSPSIWAVSGKSA